MSLTTNSWDSAAYLIYYLQLCRSSALSSALQCVKSLYILEYLSNLASFYKALYSAHQDTRTKDILQLHQLGCSLLFCKTSKNNFFTTCSEWFSTHAHVTSTLLTISVLLDLEDLLETIKLFIPNHLIHDIVHQWLNQKNKI